MMKFSTMMAVLLLSTVALAPATRAGDMAAAKSFYAFLSNPGSKSHAEAFRKNVTADWKSIGDYSGKFKTADVFVGQLGYFAKLIPDLKWKMEEVIQAGDRVIVRGRATGTPKGPLFGVDGKGKSFEIMSIDIHTLKDGKISQTYHVEDWSGALGQLKGK